MLQFFVNENYRTKNNAMEQIKLEPSSTELHPGLRIVKHQPVKPQLTEEQILERRRRTAERVRRYRERKRNQQQLVSSMVSSTLNLSYPPAQCSKAFKPTSTSQQRMLKQEAFLSSTIEPILRPSETVGILDGEEEAIESEEIMPLAQRRKKEKDPLEVVKTQLSFDNDTQMVTQMSRIEEIVVGFDNNSYSGSILGPNIHGLCYCEKNTYDTSPAVSIKYESADSTNSGAGDDANIFRRPCKQSNCCGCVVKVTSPIQHFEIPHKNLIMCTSSYHTETAVLNIAAQKGLAEATYNLFETLTSNEMILTSQQFVRMWRSILLRRVQEVQSKSTCRRVQNMIPLDCSGMLVPAPLGDLLHSIGQFHSAATGVMHRTVAPEKCPISPEDDWWVVDEVILAQWVRTMNVFKNSFMMKEMPWAADFDNKPLMMTQIQMTGPHMVMCMAKTNEIGPTDGYVHMVNDRLYDPSIYSFEECHLIVSSPIHQEYLRTEYISSYIISDEMVCF